MKPKYTHSRRNPLLPQSLCLTLSVAGLLAMPAMAATIQKANNTTNLDQAASWTGGILPGSIDTASWTSTVTGANSTVLGSDQAWRGISVTNPGGAVTIGAGNVLTLGSSGIDMATATQDLTISSGLTLNAGSGQSWNVATGRILTLNTGVFTRGAGATLLATSGAGTIATTNITNVNGILGPWAATRNGTAYNYATVSGGNISAYTATNIASTGATGGWGGITAGGDGTANWDVTVGVAAFATVGSARNVNTVRYTGTVAARQNSNSTSAAGVDIMVLNGFMNAGTGTFTIGGDPGAAAPTNVNGRLNLNVGSTKELVLSPMTADIIINGIIKDNTVAPVASGLTVSGNNKVVLNGNSTYTGPTNITSGTLQVASPVTNFGSINGTSGISIRGATAKYLHTSAVAGTKPITLTRGILDGTGSVGAVTVGAGTGGILTHGNGGVGALVLPSLTFNGAGTIQAKLAGGANTFNPVFTVTGNLTTSGGAGSVVVDVAAPAATYLNGETYQVVKYNGTLVGAGNDFIAGTIGGLTSRQSGTISNDPIGQAITLTVNGDTPMWTGADNGNWVVGSTGPNKNWKLIAANTPTDYLDQDTVRFDDSATGPTTVNISAADVSPAAMIFENSSKNYTVGSVGGFKIAGTGLLQKEGSGKVTLTNAHTFSGPTAINGGTLQLGDGVTDGSIANSSTINNDASLVYNVIGTQAYTHPINGVGSLTKQGIGTLTLSAANNYSGLTTVTAGKLTVTGSLYNLVDINIATGAILNTASGNQPLAGNISGAGTIDNTGNTVITGNFSGFTGTYRHNTSVVSTSLNSATATSKDASYVIDLPQGSAQGMIAGLAGDYTMELGSLSGVAGSLFRGGNVATGLTTLQIGNKNLNDNFLGSINDGVTKTLALTKVGTGTLTLGGINTYTGNTIVSGGTLALADNAALQFKLGANGVTNSISGTGALTLDGDFNINVAGANITSGNTWTLVNVGTLGETFGSTFTVTGFTENANVHTRVDGLNNWSFSEATGVLTLTIGNPSAYSAWATGKGLTGANNGATQDPDFDGISNALEFVLGGDPLASSTQVLPVGTQDATNFYFTFNRADDSEAEITQVFQYGSTLTGWTDVTIGATSAGDVTITENGASPDTVVVTIPKTSAVGAKLFGRLKVVK